MKAKKYISKTLALGLFPALLLLLGAANAYAQTPPDFPACTNPQGEITVSYSEGNHALPGEFFTKPGSDVVYQVSEGNYLQCFCADTGEAVQTNWWKVTSLTQEEIETLIKLGWHFIPDGADWGLEQGAYMAKNNPYACRGSDEDTGGNEDSGEEDNGGMVLAVAASDQSGVLAATGGIKPALGLFFLGTSLLVLGRKLKQAQLGP